MKVVTKNNETIPTKIAKLEEIIQSQSLEIKKLSDKLKLLEVSEEEFEELDVTLNKIPQTDGNEDFDHGYSVDDSQLEQESDTDETEDENGINDTLETIENVDAGEAMLDNAKKYRGDFLQTKPLDTNQKPYKCNICECRTVTIEDMKTHLRCQHAELLANMQNY